MTTYEVVTNKNCNLECYFCFANANLEQKKDVLSLEDFSKGFELTVTKMAPGEKGIFVKMYGGESMLHFEKVLEYLIFLNKRSKELGFKILTTIITNGTILPDDFLKKVNNLCDKNLEITLTFSMEAGRRVHDKIRTFKGGTSSFDTVLKNIEKYNKSEMKRVAGIQSVLSPEMLSDMKGYIEFMEDNKSNGVFNLVPMFDETFESVDLKILDNMKELFDYYKMCFRDGNVEHVGLFQSFRSIMAYIMLNKGFKVAHCDAGVSKIAISPNGDTYSCCRLDHVGANDTKYGHISDTHIVSKKFDESKKMYEEFTSFDLECKECQLKNKFGCTGKCLANSLQYNSEYNSKYASICEYNKTFGKMSMDLWHSLKDNPHFLKRIDKYCDYTLPEELAETVKKIIRKGEI